MEIRMADNIERIPIVASQNKSIELGTIKVWYLFVVMVLWEYGCVAVLMAISSCRIRLYIKYTYHFSVHLDQVRMNCRIIDQLVIAKRQNVNTVLNVIGDLDHVLVIFVCRLAERRLPITVMSTLTLVP